MNEPLPPHEQHIPDAKTRPRHFSAIWLIPLIAAMIAGYLGLRSYAEHGPTITISFRTADGLSAGQTAIKYKSVVLGTVEKIELNKDRDGIVARVRMNAGTDDLLTDHARFWVERPRLTSTNISDLVSGTYIQLDPGASDGASPETDFIGLENQPSLPPDESGTTYVLRAHRLGAVTEGSPVFYRDINVGKVLGYDVGDGFGPITVNVFVRKPYDQFVKPATRFWNASGFSVKLGPGGVHVELQSLQSILGGGVAFDTPAAAIKQEQASDSTNFSLYEDRKIAEASAFGKRIPCVTYMQSSIKDLAPGSPVQIFGIEVGQVTEVKLALDPSKENAKVRVAFEIEPERAFGSDSSVDVTQVMRQLVQNGMRVKMESSGLIAGEEIMSLEFAPQSAEAQIATEGDAMVLPGQSGGGLADLGDTLGDVAAKLDQIPFDEIGQHLDHLLVSAEQVIGGAEMKQAVHNLSATMANARDLSQNAKKNLSPALEKLPDISAQLQNAVTQANAFMASVNNGYGQDSDFQRDSKRTLDEVSDAARSIRLLADYLERHPEALIQGKTPDKGKP